MRRIIKDEGGEFAIDAIFGITFFMISMIALMFMSLIIRVQSNVQYALGQTAKEISGYYYLVDKIGLAAATTGSDEETDVDNVIKNVVDFSGSIENSKNTIQSIEIDDATFESIQNSAKDVENSIAESRKCFESIQSSIKGINGDSVTQILSVFAKTAVNRAVSFYIAPILCEKLMPKYLSSKKYGSISEYYEAIGIKNVSFNGSQLLTDKRSIKLQITYELDLEKYTLGVVKGSVKFRQVASTAAWVTPDGQNIQSLQGLGYQ